MTIDKEKLISLLKEKTGLEREDVESQLSELIIRIQEAADEGKTFEIEGFGTFVMDEGTLQFEPNDRLETEINNKYAGMKPIELIGAFKEPEADEEVPDMSEPSMETDEKWEFDVKADRDEGSPAPEASETEEAEKEAETAEFEKETEEIESQEEESEDQEVEKDQFEGKPSAPEGVSEESPDEVFDAVFGTKAETSDEEIEFEKDETVEPSEIESQEEKSKDTIGIFLVAAVVVISLGISGWVIYDFSYSESNIEQNTAPAAEQSEQVPQSTDNDAETSEESSAEDSEPEEVTEVPTQEESETQGNEGQERYGLHGTTNESVNSGYTIVVHSLQDAQKAEQNRQRLQEAGFRTLISEAQVQSNTYYRVGIGQFETISSAQDAIQEIPAEYRENNFIKRIQ